MVNFIIVTGIYILITCIRILCNGIVNCMSESEYLKWRNLIGNFILEFAHVEVEVFGIFEAVGHMDDIEKAKSYQFKERATKAMDLIDREIKDSKLTTPVKRALNELIKLADSKRNLIAHNPVQLSLDGVFSGDNSHEVRSFRKFDNVLTIEDLEAGFQDLIKWRDQLFGATHQIRKYISWIKSAP